MPNVDVWFLVIYTIVVSLVFIISVCFHFKSCLIRFRDYIRLPVLKYIVYRPLTRSRRFLVHWSLADTLVFLVYLGINVFCVFFKASTTRSAGLRAANFSLFHLVLLCGTPHLDSWSNLLGLRWSHIRRLHASIGVMAFIFMLIHLVEMLVPSRSFPMNKMENKGAIIVIFSHQNKSSQANHMPRQSRLWACFWLCPSSRNHITRHIFASIKP